MVACRKTKSFRQKLLNYFKKKTTKNIYIYSSELVHRNDNFAIKHSHISLFYIFSALFKHTEKITAGKIQQAKKNCPHKIY